MLGLQRSNNSKCKSNFLIIYKLLRYTGSIGFQTAVPCPGSPRNINNNSN
jgi:hypothetical protein